MDISGRTWKDYDKYIGRISTAKNLLPKNKASTSVETASYPCSRQEHSLDPALDAGVVGTATIVSPSTDAEYDKLTVRE